MDDPTSYDVRFYKTVVYKGSKVTSYTVRWKVTGEEWKEPFRVVAQSESFRSELVTAARKGEAFSTRTGRPVSWQRDEPEEPAQNDQLGAAQLKIINWLAAAPIGGYCTSSASWTSTECDIRSAARCAPGGMRRAGFPFR